MSNFASDIHTKESLRAKLKAHIDAYLAKGGVISEIPSGYATLSHDDQYKDRRRSAERHPNKLAFSFNAHKKDRNLTH